MKKQHIKNNHNVTRCEDELLLAVVFHVFPVVRRENTCSGSLARITDIPEAPWGYICGKRLGLTV